MDDELHNRVNSHRNVMKLTEWKPQIVEDIKTDKETIQKVS